MNWQRGASILGVGFAYPETVLDNIVLAEAAPSLTPEQIFVKSGIVSRRTVLPLQYILESKNLDAQAAVKVMRESPTDLAVRACEMALERASVKPEQIGLIIGDGATPLETTPSEAQRVGERFGLKTVAYDIYSSSCAGILHLHTLASWREDQVPDYVLCVSANTPTRCVNYAEGDARLFFGDGAMAMVISTKERGRLVVVDSFFSSEPAESDLIIADIYGHIRLRDDTLFRVRDKTSEMLHRANLQNKLDMEKIRFIGTQISPLLLGEISKKYLLDSPCIWQSCERNGYALGAAEFCVLAQKWDEIDANDTVVLASAGGGLSFGYVVLKGME